MKIFETKPKISNDVAAATRLYHSNDEGNRNDLHDKLAKMGWKRLGDGAFSSVYKNPKKSYVMKINFLPDAEYNKFIRLTKKYPNKHFPKVSNLKKIVLSNKHAGEITYYIYLIEPLLKLPYNSAEKYAAWFYEIAWANGDPTEKPYLNDIFKNRVVPDIFQKNPALLRALRIIGLHASEETLDINSGNIMKRKDGTIIITDPYA